jgi:hypothetical protein
VLMEFGIQNITAVPTTLIRLAAIVKAPCIQLLQSIVIKITICCNEKQIDKWLIYFGPISLVICRMSIPYTSPVLTSLLSIVISSSKDATMLNMQPLFPNSRVRL